MKYTISTNGYYYKEYKNGKKIRVSKKIFDKNNKVLQKGGTINENKNWYILADLRYTLHFKLTYSNEQKHQLLPEIFEKGEKIQNLYKKNENNYIIADFKIYSSKLRKKVPLNLYFIKDRIYTMTFSKIEDYLLMPIEESINEIDKYLNGTIPLYIREPAYQVSSSNQNEMIFNKGSINKFLLNITEEKKKQLIKTKRNSNENSYTVVLNDFYKTNKDKSKYFNKKNIEKIAKSLVIPKNTGAIYTQIKEPVIRTWGVVQIIPEI